MNTKKMIATLVLTLGLISFAGLGFGAMTQITFLNQSTPYDYVAGSATGADFGQGIKLASGHLSLTTTDLTRLVISGPDNGIFAPVTSSDLFIGNERFDNAGSPLGTRGPVAVLLESSATEFVFYTGYVDNITSLKITLWDDAGNSLGISKGLTPGSYNEVRVYASDFGDKAFRGLEFSEFGADLAGIEFGKMSYTAVPLPATVWLLGSALAGVVLVRRRK
jgi:hypothetical protein